MVSFGAMVSCEILLTLTLPYPTKSNKRVFLLAHVRSVYDDVINQIHIPGAIPQYTAPRRGLARVWFAWHADGQGSSPGRGATKNKTFLPGFDPLPSSLLKTAIV